MRSTFYTLDDRFIVLNVPLDEKIHISEAGGNAYQQREQSKIGFRLQLLVEPSSQIETSEDGDDHGDADAAHTGHLDRGLLRLLVHRAPLNTSRS